MNHRVAGGVVALLCLTACIVVTSAGAAPTRPTERVSPAPEVNSHAVGWRTPTPPGRPQAGDVWVNPKDGAAMVYIPSGKFTLGTRDAEIDAWLKWHLADQRQLFQDEQPQCRVNLPGYWIGRTEVTNAQYRRFVQVTGHRAPDHWKGGQAPPGLDNLPVVFVDFDDAHAYCEWAGGHLPTELQWEKAARGTDGRQYPWGNAWDPDKCANWSNSRDAQPVGRYPAGASPYGCLDTVGNVWEWCADWYNPYAYKRYAKGDLRPPRKGEEPALRGASWARGTNPPFYFRCACRDADDPVIRDINGGFRCARGLP